MKLKKQEPRHMCISPKVLDIDSNRIDNTDMKSNNNMNKKEYHNAQSKSLDNGKEGTGLIRMSVYNKLGRFPTQLFTNDNSEKFKYVKNVY